MYDKKLCSAYNGNVDRDALEIQVICDPEKIAGQSKSAIINL